MMRVEEALIELGEHPLHRSSYSNVLIAILNAYLPQRVRVTLNNTGQHVLTVIYQLSDETLQEKILQKKLGTVRNKDAYRTSVLWLSGLLSMGVVLYAVIEVVSQGSPSSEILQYLMGLESP